MPVQDAVALHIVRSKTAHKPLHTSPYTFTLDILYDIQYSTTYR